MIDPAALARHYSRFRVSERILLTGHAHQAWPDVAFEAQQQAWLDAAEHVDGKWNFAAEQAGRVQEGFAALLGDSPAHIALGQNTHELVVRWVSALPLQDRRQIVTTDGEFGSWRRQADRLAEEPLEIARVHARPAETLAERLAAVISDNLTRLIARSTGPDPEDVFITLGGGSTFRTSFYKYDYLTDAMTSQIFNDGETGAVQDMDYAAADTTKGAAVTAGVKIGNINVYGGLFVSADGGRTWDRIEEAKASVQTQTYYGVAVKNNGDIYVSGGSGYFARWTPDGDGTYTEQRLLEDAVANPDPNDPQSLIFTDVQFAPDDETKGWLVGGQLLGFVGDVPQYRGLIFETRDGGATWTRQGVREAEEYGALFPRLNRLDVLSAENAWAVGNGGAVITYQPGQ